MFAVNSMHVK